MPKPTWVLPTAGVPDPRERYACIALKKTAARQGYTKSVALQKAAPAIRREKICLSRLVNAVRRWQRRRRAAEEATKTAGVLTWIRGRVWWCRTERHRLWSRLPSPRLRIAEWLIPSLERVPSAHADEPACRSLLLEEEAYTRLLLTVQHLLLPSRRPAAALLNCRGLLPLSSIRLASSALSAANSQATHRLLLGAIGYASDLNAACEVFVLAKEALKQWGRVLRQGLEELHARGADILCREHSRAAVLLRCVVEEASSRRSLEEEASWGAGFFADCSFGNAPGPPPLRFLAKGGQGVLSLLPSGRVLKELTCHSLADLQERYANAVRHRHLVSGRNPHVVEYLDVSPVVSRCGKPVLRVTMPFYPGGSLAGVADPAQAVAAVADVASALGYLHSLTPPVVHRDVKPSNVVLTSSSRAVLLDFDSSKPLLGTAISSQGGTYQFTAPETLVWFRTTPASDVFSLGVVLFQLLTRREHPVLPCPVTLDGSSVLVNSDKWGNGPHLEQAMRVALAASSIAQPPELHSLVVAMCRHDPATRPSASQISSILRAILPEVP